MKRSRYSDEQISYALRQAEGGTAIADVCRGLGISEATFYVWKKAAQRLPGAVSAAKCQRMGVRHPTQAPAITWLARANGGN